MYQICLETHSPKNHIDFVFKQIDYVYRHRFPLKEGTYMEPRRLNNFGDLGLQGHNMAQSLIKL